jgi:3-oxoacyl-[acyl-carrier-protein] synthase-1
MSILAIIESANVITPLGNSIEECVSSILSGKSAIKKIDKDDPLYEFGIPFVGKINWSQIGFDPTVEESKSCFLFEKMLYDLLIKNKIEKLDSIILMESSRTFCSINEFYKKIYSDVELLDFSELSNSRNPQFYVKKVLQSFDIQIELENIHFIDNTCTTGISLITFAKQAIEAGIWETVLICAIDLIDEYNLNYLKGLGALNTKATKITEASTPFNKIRNGFVKSEGGAVAIMRGIHGNKSPHALNVKGFSQTNDAYRLTDGRDDALSLSRSMKESIQRSNINSKEISFIKSHGTGTFLNDLHEATAIRSAFADYLNVPVTSLKGHLGHTTDASGLIESLIAGFAFLDNKILPTLNCHESNLGLNIVKDLQIDNEKKFFLSSSSGFGGCNASVVFEKLD